MTGFEPDKFWGRGVVKPLQVLNRNVAGMEFEDIWNINYFKMLIFFQLPALWSLLLVK